MNSAPKKARCDLIDLIENRGECDVFFAYLQSKDRVFKWEWGCFFLGENFMGILMVCLGFLWGFDDVGSVLGEPLSPGIDWRYRFHL